MICASVLVLKGKTSSANVLKDAITFHCCNLLLFALLSARFSLYLILLLAYWILIIASSRLQLSSILHRQKGYQFGLF